MPLIKAQVRLPMFTNLPRDVITNTLYFAADESLTLATAAPIINDNLETFYQSIYSLTWPMANYMTLVGAQVRYYDMSQPEPRVPLTILFDPTVQTLTASAIPTEVAMVLSFEGITVPGVPQARRRGRIYIGALSTSTIDTSTTGQFPRIAAARMGSLQTALTNLRSQCDADLVPWCVYSPTLGLATPIVKGWIDNSPDTQRRRSVAANARTLWP